jgi:thiol-disulfide isomerase/thioredoxin
MKTKTVRLILGLTLFGLLAACDPIAEFRSRKDTLSAEAYKTFLTTHLEPVPLKHLHQVDVDYRLLDGRSENLRDNAGKALLINFWSSWCYPCRIEMPDLESLNGLMQSENFRILAVNYGETEAKVERFLRQNPYVFDVVLDETTAFSQRFAIEGLPTTYVIDREGHILGKITGPKDWKNPSMVAFFRTISR